MRRVGIYELGYEKVALVVNPNAKGGSFNFCDPKLGVSRIVVGLDYLHFHHVLNVLVHEALEFALTRLGARYTPSQDLAGDMGAYHFSFGHTTLSEASFMVAEYVHEALGPLRGQWDAEANTRTSGDR